METIRCDAFEYKVTLRLNGKERNRFYFATSKEEAMLKAVNPQFAAEGLPEQVIGAEFTGRIIKDGVIR